MSKLAMTGHPLAAWLRRAVGLALIVGLLISAVAFYRVAPQLQRATPVASSTTNSPSTATSPATAGPARRSPEASPSPNASAKRVPPTQAEVKLPRGPGTTEPGILLMASPLRDGSFDVAELVILPSQVSSVRLAPPKLAPGGKPFGGLKPVASEVQMSADNQPVIVPKGQVDSRLEIALVEPANRMELRYQLHDVTVRSIPSRAGRALAVISPLAAGDPSLHVVMMVSGGTVRNIQCPMRRGISGQTCTAGRVPHLRAKGELPLSRAVIIVQFDLPRT